MKEREIVIVNNNVHVVKKTIEATIPISEFAGNIVERDMFFETKQLPVNCIKYETRTDIDRYFCCIPEDNYRFNYNGKLYIVRIPNTILIFTFDKDRISLKKDIMMLWTSDKNLDITSPTFFIPPLHNIYDNGKICAGHSRIQTTNQHDFINQYMVNLFTTEFNDDLSSGKRTMKNVSADQYKYKDVIVDHHDIVQLWWKKLIHEKIDGKDIYVLSKDVLRIDKKTLGEWIS